MSKYVNYAKARQKERDAAKAAMQAQLRQRDAEYAAWERDNGIAPIVTIVDGVRIENRGQRVTVSCRPRKTISEHVVVASEAPKLYETIRACSERNNRLRSEARRKAKAAGEGEP